MRLSIKQVATVHLPTTRKWPSQGNDETEALANIREAVAGCLESRAANGMPLTIEVREAEVPA